MLNEIIPYIINYIVFLSTSSHYDSTVDHMIYHKNHPSTSSPRNRRSHMDHMTSDIKRSSRSSNSPMRQESLVNNY